MLLEKLTQITKMGKWRITKSCNLAGSLNVRYLYFRPVRAAQYCWLFSCKIHNAIKTTTAQNVGAMYFLYLKKCTWTAAVPSKENNLQRTKLKSANPSFPRTANKPFSSSAHSWDETKDSKTNASSECSHREYLQVLCTGWLDRGLFKKFPR